MADLMPLFFRPPTNTTSFFFFCNDTAPTEFSPLPLPDALPIYRVGVFAPQPAAARHAGADARMAAMEDRRQLVLGNHLIERIRHPVVREETLDGGVELEEIGRAHV